MKELLIKLFAITLLINTMINNVNAADLTGDAMPIEMEFADISNIYEDYYKFSYKGNNYYFNQKNTISPQIYNQAEFDFFIKERGMTTYEKINEDVYVAVYYCAPYKKVFEGGDSWKGHQDFKLEFYDVNFNLINSIQSRYYIRTYEYINGKYYYSTVGYECIEHESEDMINWKRITRIKSPMENNILLNLSDVVYTAEYYNELHYKEYLMLNNRIKHEVQYEDKIGFGKLSVINKGIFLKNSDEKYQEEFFVSYDGVNFITLSFEGMEDLKPNDNYTPVERKYVTDNYFVIETETQRITVPMSEINAELDKLKSVPYINLNGKLLAFEVPPTIQDDRTLVPMRFLFEQMDAEVEWDNDTQTATVYKNDDTIAFSIDDTEAEVNNTTKTMEVPARLINGKTMIPLRFLSEELGYTVEWNEELRMVTITE